jgi:hypothetical protein
MTVSLRHIPLSALAAVALAACGSSSQHPRVASDEGSGDSGIAGRLPFARSATQTAVRRLVVILWPARRVSNIGAPGLEPATTGCAEVNPQCLRGSQVLSRTFRFARNATRLL